MLTDGDGWDTAGVLVPDHASTMQRAEGAHIVDARFGWGPDSLYLLLIPQDDAELTGLRARAEGDAGRRRARVDI